MDGAAHEMNESEESPEVVKALSLASRTSRSSLSSGSSLPMTLEAELLRAVSAKVALSGWGKHWRSSHAPASAHHLSRRVKALDVFLSHDWETSAFLKFLTLLLVFNSRAACIASLVVSLLLGAARLLGIFPDELWSVSFSYLTFLLILCFWQRIRSMFGTGVMVFLDKLCISQDDPDLKQRGILGLGAFLQNSRRLLVLWSPRYFSRLWCTYEIGCFLLKEECEIEIMPVKSAFILYLTSIVWHLLLISYHVLFTFFGQKALHTGDTGGQGFGSFLAITSAMPALASLILPVMNYVGLTMMRDVAQLPGQLRDFRVQDSQCFCCTHDHRHPHTGQEMLCDRSLVYNTLIDMYSTCRLGGDLDPLRRFDGRVQSQLQAKVTQRLGGGLPLKYTTYLVMASNVPFLSELMSSLGKGPPLSHQDRIAWCIRLILSWLQPYLAIVLAIGVSQLLWQKLQFSASVLLAICISPLIAMAVTIAWASFELALLRTDDGSLLPLVPFVLELLLVIWLIIRTQQSWDGSSSDKRCASQTMNQMEPPASGTCKWEENDDDGNASSRACEEVLSM